MQPTPFQSPLTPAITSVSTDEMLTDLFIRSKRAAATKEAYGRDIAIFREFTNDVPLQTMTVETLLSFAEAIAETDAAVATQRRILSSIKSLFTYGHKIGYLPFNTAKMVNLPTVENTLTEKLLPESDVIAMIRLTERPLDLAILITLYATGMRVSELCALQWRNFNRENKTVSWFSVKSKRTITQLIEAKAFWNALDGLTRRNFAFVFVTQKKTAISRQHVDRLVKKAAVRAGVKDAHLVSPHWLRHAKASHALQNGASIALVSRELGHSSIAITSMYTHARPDDSGAGYLKL